MNNLKNIIGYAAAVAGLLFFVCSFLFSDKLEKLVVLSGIHPSEWYSGGSILKIEKCQGYVMKIHKPVFNKLFFTEKTGFIQLTFTGMPDLPRIIRKSISVNGYDFTFETDTGKLITTLVSAGAKVKEVLWTYRFRDKSINVRIAIWGSRLN